jgi:nucleotide-binding universal stress UspA family protein
MVKMGCRFENIKKILIPTDGSDYSTRAAEYGIGVAKMLGAEVVVIYVIDMVVLNQISKVTEREDVERELKQDGQRYINYVLSLAEEAGVKATSLLAKGRPFEQIVHLAKGLDVDLIVMGTYGRRGAERILIGSVAERVIEYSTCPVLVVK